MSVAERLVDPPGAVFLPGVETADREPVAAEARPPRRWERESTGQLVLAVVAAAALVWLPGAGVDVWLDEALSISIAQEPLAALVDALRGDGSPPLYYLLLKVWAAAFGWSETSIHMLSVLVALAGLVAGTVAVERRYGRQVATAFGGLGVVTPAVAYYATEARPYALLFSLSLAATLLMLRSIESERPAARVALGVVLAITCYSHNWGIFLSIGTLASLAVSTPGGVLDRVRRAAMPGIVLFLLYLPWSAVALQQRSSTGAPWLAPPSDLWRVVVDLDRMSGTLVATLLTIVVLGAGLVLVRSRDFVALMVQATSTSAVGWLFSMLVTPAFANRYLIVVAPPLLLMLALATTERRLRIGVLAIAALGLLASLQHVTLRTDEYKSRAERIAAAIDEARRTSPNLLVVAPDNALPAVRYYLSDTSTLAFHTYLGPTADPGLVDWTDVTAAMREWDPVQALPVELVAADRVILLFDGGKSDRLGNTEYWDARLDAARRAQQALDAQRGLDLVERWSYGEWTARIYQVTGDQS